MIVTRNLKRINSLFYQNKNAKRIQINFRSFPLPQKFLLGMPYFSSHNTIITLRSIFQNIYFQNGSNFRIKLVPSFTNKIFL